VLFPSDLMKCEQTVGRRVKRQRKRERERVRKIAQGMILLAGREGNRSYSSPFVWEEG